MKTHLWQAKIIKTFHYYMVWFASQTSHKDNAHLDKSYTSTGYDFTARKE